MNGELLFVLITYIIIKNKMKIHFACAIVIFLQYSFVKSYESVEDIQMIQQLRDKIQVFLGLYNR